MATYTYTTNADEDAALDIELMKINGQLVSQNQPAVDLQGLFTLFVQQRLHPIAQQALQSRAQPLLAAFMKADEPTRAQMLAAVPIVKA